MQQPPDWVEQDDDPFPPIEGRTLLFGLPPIGVGTPDCESLSSYVIRLAREHSLPPRRFISRIILGVLGQGKPRCDAKFFRHYAATINGVGPYAERFVRALGETTGRSDLLSLTMQPWKGLLAPNGTPLTSACRRWCSACLRDSGVRNASDNQSSEAYWPLSWSISAVSCCLKHRASLSEVCQHCARHQPTLPKHAEFDRCDYCRKCLYDSDATNGPILPESEASTAAPVADLVGQMIRLGPTVDQGDAHNRWVDYIAKHIAEAGSDRASVCREMGLNPRAMYEWFERRAGVSLGSALKVCLRLGVSMDAVFGPPNSHVTSATPPMALPGREGPRQRHDHAMRVRAKAALDSTLVAAEPLTLRAISDQLGVSTGYLRYWFPNEVAALNAINRRRLLETREIRQRLDAALIESTVHAMIKQGTYPGRKRVEAAMRAAGTSLMSSSNLNVYRTAIALKLKR